MGRRVGSRILIARPAFGSRSVWWLAGTILVSVGLLAACSEDRSLDVGSVEADLRAQILPEYPGAIDRIVCPEVLDPMVGDTFTCVGSVGDQRIDIAVVLGGTAEALSASASVDARLVAVDEVAALLASTFEREVGLATSVDCGVPVAILEPAGTLECAATDPAGVVRWFDVTVDDQGVLGLTLQ